MKRVRIKALRQACHADLVALYENQLDNPCSVSVGQEWMCIDGQKPETLCESAWLTMKPFVDELAAGGGNFYDGWMRNPHSALISCNDGFRPVSFLLEALD